MNFVLQSSALKFSLQKTSTRQYFKFLPIPSIMPAWKCCLFPNLDPINTIWTQETRAFSKAKVHLKKKKGAYILRNFFPHSN